MSELQRVTSWREAAAQFRDRRDWWATLEPAALDDETRTNRRQEYWVSVATGVAIGVTVFLLWLHGGPGW